MIGNSEKCGIPLHIALGFSVHLETNSSAKREDGRGGPDSLKTGEMA